MATLEAKREETTAVWRREARGVYVTRDHRWKVEADEVVGWWLCERTNDGWAYVEPFAYLRDAKEWVAHTLAAEDAKQRELWIDHAPIEAGNGTVHRLRLMQGEKALREIIVRGGRMAAVKTAYLRDKTEWGMGRQEAEAFAAMVMQAAALIEGDD